MLTTSIVNVCDEREWCTDYGTPNWVLVHFNSVIKCVKQCCCTLILLPTSTLNANLTTTNRFFTNDDWQRRRFENFESDNQYESNLESDVRFEIESNHEASQVPTHQDTFNRLCILCWYFLSFKTNIEKASLQHNEHHCISTNDKYLLLLLLRLQLMFIVPTISTHTGFPDQYATDLLSYRWRMWAPPL